MCLINQDVYRIGKCFSLTDCYYKTSLLVSLFLSDDDIVLCCPLRNIQEDIRYKAGLVSVMIDALALSGKCTSGPNKS